MSTKRTGNISVQTADIFPIIKKWLYSEHDIFLRELVSNATDAITKRAATARTRNEEIPVGRIRVAVSPKARTIAIEDNGIGMTEEEVEKYIARLAFSGAEEFVEKMKEAGEGADIIGKFGLGFYSAFMVADKVEIDTLSMEADSKAVKWTCQGDPEYVFEEGERTEVGTTVVLHVGKEGEEFLGEYKVSGTLGNFCDFMPYEISVVDTERKVKPTKDDGSVDEAAAEVAAEPTVVNETEPLWKKDPKELKDEDYRDFFGKLFPVEPPPLFWIHLKVDHPFSLEGILYFPKINPMKPFQEKNIRLFCKQVFVSDNVKNIIPDFLSLLKGAIDSSDIPLNVSRSSLQGDPNIQKISNYVTKKVAESLKKLFKSDRKRYEEIWPDIGLFVKYGSISDAKFSELMLPYILFKGNTGNFLTFREYRESVPEKYREKMKDKFLYFEKNKSDYSLREQLKAEGIETIETDEYVDPHFMQHLEVGQIGDDKKEKFTFAGLEGEIHNLFGTESATGEDIKVKELFESVLAPKKEGDGDDPNKTEIEVQKIKNSPTPAYFKVDEQMKRFQKMSEGMGRTAGAFPLKKTLVINPTNPLIQNALKIHEKGGKGELVDKICHHIEDLALISGEGLKDGQKEVFVRRGQELLSELSGLAAAAGD